MERQLSTPAQSQRKRLEDWRHRLPGRLEALRETLRVAGMATPHQQLAVVVAT